MFTYQGGRLLQLDQLFETSVTRGHAQDTDTQLDAK